MPGEKRGEKNGMEQEDGRKQDANVNTKWNGKDGGEGKAGSKEKIIAVVDLGTEGKGNAGRGGAVVVMRGKRKGAGNRT
jgi:hypothetical protein